MAFFNPAYYAVMGGVQRPQYGANGANAGQRVELREVALTAGAQAVGAALATAGAAWILTRMFRKQEEKEAAQRTAAPAGRQVHLYLPAGADPDAWAPVINTALRGGEFVPFATEAL